MGQESTNPPLSYSLPHVLVATIVSFLFGYHLGVVNESLESISTDLGFTGNTLAEGLMVSTCLGGVFVGSLLSGWIADGAGRQRAFQLCALPMVIGASASASTNNLAGMLLGRFLVGIGLGIGPPVASLYVTEVSPPYVRGTFGSFIQIATCLGLMVALFIGIPVKNVAGWWRLCFWVSTIPAALLALAMTFCAESPHWLYKVGAIVYLKSFVNQDHVVAKGIISSIDPTTQVGGLELGRNWCEVQVQVPVDWDEEINQAVWNFHYDWRCDMCVIFVLLLILIYIFYS